MSFVRSAMGVGAVQANMALFGAEQAQEDKTTVRYFDVYYAAVNTGGLLAFGAIAYLQINTDFFIGYLVPGGLLITGFVLFTAGYPWYIHRKPQKSLITEFLPTVVNACQSWRNHRDASVESSDRPSRPLDSWLDYAMVENQGRFSARTVNDIKSFGRIVVVFLLLIPYWLLYVQVETTFIVQGAHMKLPTAFDKLPVVWLSLGNQIIIIGRCDMPRVASSKHCSFHSASIMFLNAFVYKRLQASGRSFSIKSRIIIGMISATFAMCLAGAVEIFRQDICQTQNFTQTIGTRLLEIHFHSHSRCPLGDKQYLAANMSILYQFPQYVGIGLSEVFTSVASLEFAYLAAPRSAQSLIMSLRFCSAGLSSFVGSGLVSVLSIEVKSHSLSTVRTRSLCIRRMEIKHGHTAKHIVTTDDISSISSFSPASNSPSY